MAGSRCYGYVNRAVPDVQLDAFVDEIADSLASFDKTALGQTKHYVEEVSLADQGVSRGPARWVNGPGMSGDLGG